MKYNVKTRFLSLVLCVCMLVPMLTQIIPVYSVGEEPETQDKTETFKDNVGKQAIFDWWSSFDVAPENGSVPGEAITVSYDDSGIAERAFVIVDYYYNENDGSHWYKLSARDGETLPSVLQENPWVLYTSDFETEEGLDPYLCIYEADETIRFVTSERLTYETDEEGNTVTDDDGNPILKGKYINYYVFAGPAALKNAEISITSLDSDYPVSALAYVETTYGTTFSKAFDITITKSNKEAWTPSDGLISVRYESEQFGTDTYNEDCACGAGFVYIENQMYSATSTDRFGNEISDVVYTNSGSFTLVFEIMDPSFEYVGESAYFKNDKVALFSNTFEPKSFLAAELPATFTVAYSFKHVEFDTEYTYYWLESDGFIGSPYFLARAEDVELGKLPEEYGDGRVTITDKDGEAVDAITLPMYQKPEFEAVSSLTMLTADVKYQWQIEYEEGKWVDIYGEDEKTVKLSFGMVASLLDEDGSVNIRCETKSASLVAYSKTIPVTLEMYQPEEPDVVVSDSFVSSNGETVTVTVAGNIPEDASVALEETDTTGVEVAPGEKVTASLDISIKNADGTEWQPESGETVKVTLDASSLGLKDGDNFVIYHLHNGEVKVLGTYTVVNNTVSFTVDGFSKFVFALAAEEHNFDDCLELYAAFNAYNEWTYEGTFDYFWLETDPTDEVEDIFEWSIYDEDFEIDLVVKTKEYYVDSEGGLWFLVEPVNGLDLPASLKEHPWIHMNNVDQYDSEYDTLYLFEPEDVSEEEIVVVDKYGLPAWELYMYSNEKKAITTQTSLTGSVKYQWQVCYDIENLLWMDISGQTSETLNVSFPMLAGVIQDGEWAAVRCVASNAAESATSNVIIVRFVLTETLYAINEIISQIAPTVYSVSKANEAVEETTVTPRVGEKVVITLTAKKEDGTVIFQEPYELEMNGDVSRVGVKIPYIKGFDLKDADGNVLTLGTNDQGETCYLYDVVYNDVTESFEIVLTYKPGTTTYKVIYYLQNVLDEKYTQSGEPIIIEGITGEMVDVTNEAFDKSFDGFYQLLFEKAEIASDGSTEIEVYYDRLYYKMLFDLDGGYGVQPVYARYETPVTVDKPTKAGYGFFGWDSNMGWTEDIITGTITEWQLDADESADIFEFVDIKVPAYHTSYKAIWQATNTAPVTVVIWGQNADDNGYSYMADASEGLSFGAKPGTTVTYDPNGGYVCGYSETHTHGATCSTNCGRTAHTHTDACYVRICGKEEHTEHTNACWSCGGVTAHTISCYTSSNGTLSTTAETDSGRLATLRSMTEPNTNGGLYRISSGYSYRYYFKFGDAFYQVSGTGVGRNTTVTEKENCGHTHLEHTSSCHMTCEEHAHVDACYNLTCTTEVHEHGALCYSCGKEEHTHGSECTLTINGMASNLWTFSHADTVTVAADGSTTLNVFFTRKEFTLTFNYDYTAGSWGSNGKYNKTETITARWGQDISADFVKITDNAKSSFWATSNGGSTYVNYIGIMPKNNDEFWNRGASGSDGTMTYYGEGLDGGWKVLFTVSGVGGYNVTVEDRYEFEGYTYDHGTNTGADCEGATFYYTRNKYNLVFDNYGTTEKSESVLYEAPLSTYGSFTLDASKAPAIYQPGSIIFKGWYLAPQTPNDFVFDKDGDKVEDINPFDFANSEMPASDLILYAWWEPVSHDVTFYHSYEDLEANKIYEADGITFDYKVPHGSTIKSPYTPPNDPTNGKYKFVGWFYVDALGQEQMWDFENTTVTYDVKIYAKWTSNTLMDYTIKYVYKDASGNETVIADPITGSALAGNTKTFEAKVGSALKPGYQTRYFPIEQSHSLTIDIEDETKNVYTFYYVYRETVPYKVYYLTKEDPGINLGTTTYKGETYYLIAKTKSVDDNDKAIVTENAQLIAGYVFDEYQKRLNIDPNDSTKNVLYFIYEKDVVNGQYVVHYMIQNTAGNGFYEHSAFTGKMSGGSTYSVPNPPKEIEHFTWAEGYNDGTNIEKMTGTVEVGKVLELWVYYTRDVHNYKVQYLDQATGLPVYTEKTGSAKWESQITETFVDVDGYDLVNNTSYTIDISENENENVITFYYVKDVTIKYEVVGPTGCGTVTPGSETIGVITGKATGSTATANGNVYKFVGWYDNKDCTGDPISTDATYVPTKADGTLWVDGTTYYAKFEYNLTSLTIKKSGAEGYKDIDPNQTFIFNINGNGVNIDVTVHRDEDGNWKTVIDGLTVGATYTITEKTDWSWRYNCTGWSHDKGGSGSGNVATITLGLDGTITFTNTRSEEKWLDGDSWCDNIFTTATVQNVNS